MTVSLNTSHPLASNTKLLIMVDPTTGDLVDLARSGVSFTLDAGVTKVTETIGKVIRCAGANGTSKGFSWSPAYSGGSNATGFAGTLFMVINKMTDSWSNGGYSIKPSSGNSISCLMYPAFDASGNLMLAPGNLASMSASVAVSPAKNYKIDGLRHSLAATTSNPSGGYTGKMQGTLYADGVNTGVTISNGDAGDYALGGFAQLSNLSWAGDFVLFAWFDKVLTDAEIASLHDSVGNNGAFALVSGTVAGPSSPSGTVTIGTITTASTSATVPFTYSDSDQTGYEYRLNGGTVVTAGTNSPITLTGLTASTTYTIEVRAVNATGSGSWSASKSFTTSAPAGDTTNPVLTGTITVTGISSTGYTLTWSAGTDNVAVTGYEVQINALGYVDNGSSLTKVVSGRTAGSTDTVYVRAYDAAGNRSTAISTTVNLTALSVGNLSLTDALVNNTGTKLTNATGIKAVIVRDSDFAPIATASALTTNASGILSTISSSLIVAGTAYRVVIKLSDGGVGVSTPITAV